MAENWTEQEKNVVTIGALVLAFIVGGGVGIAALFASLERWMIDAGVLVRTPGLVVEFPWSPGVGLDMPRVVIAVGIVLVLALVAVYGVVVLRRRLTTSRETRR